MFSAYAASFYCFILRIEYTYLQVSPLASSLESKIIPKTCAWLLDSQHLQVGCSEATNLEFSVYHTFVSKCVCIYNTHTCVYIEHIHSKIYKMHGLSYVSYVMAYNIIGCIYETYKIYTFIIYIWKLDMVWCSIGGRNI